MILVIQVLAWNRHNNVAELNSIMESRPVLSTGPPPVKHHYITEILLKVALNTINQTTNLLRPFGTLAPTNISVYLFTISFPAERYSRNTS
jgi:hypothetical protein